MTERTSLKDKVALVTGGGTGIGKGIALALAAEGARIVVCGRREDRIEKAVEAIWQAGAGGLAVQADISDPEDVATLVKTSLDEYGQIDILVNNAGVFEESPVHSLDLAAWDRMMNINLRGAFLTTRAVLPHMRSRKIGHIINISSESGIEFYGGDAAYGVSKHELNDFGEYVQKENQDHNIRLNTICPGMVVSEMSEGSVGLDESKCLYPEDIAELVIFLLTRRQNIKIGTPILIQTMLNPWE
jgi:3-oxoacyl-[acyl-carrier protein] reductase